MVMYEQDMKALTSEQCRNKFFPNKEVLMKKKVVSVLMAAAMVAGMAGCGSSNTGNAGTRRDHHYGRWNCFHTGKRTGRVHC